MSPQFIQERKWQSSSHIASHLPQFPACTGISINGQMLHSLNYQFYNSFILSIEFFLFYKNRDFNLFIHLYVNKFILLIKKCQIKKDSFMIQLKIQRKLGRLECLDGLFCLFLLSSMAYPQCVSESDLICEYRCILDFI